MTAKKKTKTILTGLAQQRCHSSALNLSPEQGDMK